MVLLGVGLPIIYGLITVVGPPLKMMPIFVIVAAVKIIITVSVLSHILTRVLPYVTNYVFV